MFAWVNGLPAIARFLFWVAVIIVFVFILSLIIGPLGGFDWIVHIGHFTFQISDH